MTITTLSNLNFSVSKVIVKLFIDVNPFFKIRIFGDSPKS